MKNFAAGVVLLIAGTLNAQWDTISTGFNLKYEAIAFKDANNGVVLGNDPASTGFGQVMYTTDRGNTWNIYFPYYLDRHDADFTLVGNLWIVGDSGKITLVGYPQPSPIFTGYITQNDLYCGFAVNDSAFYCAGENGVAFRTFDYGLTWDTLDTQTSDNINDIYFADAANGWIAGNDGLLKVTADSGSTWTWVSTPLFAFYDYNGFAYQDSMGLNPYVVGQSGNAQFSTDGGVNWLSFSTGTTGDIQKIRFLNSLSGLMCGEDGYIYRTENGGWSWFSDPSSETVDLFDIAFAGDTTAFICGDSGVVLRSRTDISTVHQYSAPTVAAKAYPNPTSGPLFVEVLLREESNVEIQLVNLTGQVIQANYYENVSAGTQRFEVPTSDCAAGMYFIRVQVDGAVVTMPVIRN